MLDAGVPLPLVSARLGHGPIRTTMEIYAHMIHRSTMRPRGRVRGVPEAQLGGEADWRSSVMQSRGSRRRGCSVQVT